MRNSSIVQTAVAFGSRWTRSITVVSFGSRWNWSWPPSRSAVTGTDQRPTFPSAATGT